jgi:hypothetical protein
VRLSGLVKLSESDFWQLLQLGDTGDQRADLGDANEQRVDHGCLRDRALVPRIDFRERQQERHNDLGPSITLSVPSPIRARLGSARHPQGASQASSYRIKAFRKIERWGWRRVASPAR